MNKICSDPKGELIRDTISQFYGLFSYIKDIEEVIHMRTISVLGACEDNRR